MNLHQVEGCNQFKLCELQQRALFLYAAISRTFSISNLNCNKIDIRILFATNFFIPRVTERARLDESVEIIDELFRRERRFKERV